MCSRKQKKENGNSCAKEIRAQFLLCFFFLFALDYTNLKGVGIEIEGV